MRQLTLCEHGVVRRGAPNREILHASGADAWLPAHLYDRLRRVDQARRDGASSDNTVFEWGYKRARARQYVGVMQLPGLQVEIVPKIDDPAASANNLSRARDNLLVMLCETGAIPFKPRDLADLQTQRQRMPLYDTLILLYAQALQHELLRGRARDYRQFEAQLPVLRGKLCFGQHMAHNAARRSRFYCQFEEFTPDTAMNRVLKASVMVLLRQVQTRHAEQALRRCAMLLDEVSTVARPALWLDRVHITRKNARFGDVFAMARMILQQLTPNLATGEQHIFSLLFDMNRIFEEFVGRMVLRAAQTQPNESRLYLQAKGHTRPLMRTEFEGDERGVLSLQPDILVCDPADSPRLIMDTKWKRLQRPGTPQMGISASDLYQMHAYMHRFGLIRSLLIYPHVYGARARDFRPLNRDHAPDGTTVGVRFVDLGRNLRDPREFQRLVRRLGAWLG